ncbi:MAG: biotin/lipoyl-containing protein, partial [Candidatus Nanopelagicales bacterium]
MSEVKTFLLPDVGEGLTEAEILSWHVKAGDTVVVNQTIVEIETAKAAVELPCPFAGTVTEVFVSEGETVAVGTPILAIATGAGGSEVPAASPASDMIPAVAAEPDEGKREAVLVGYGVKQTGAPQRRQRVPHVTPHGAPEVEAGPPGEAARPVRYGSLEVGRHTEEVLSRRSPVLAKPPVRKLAKDLGVDLATVDATGDGG